MTVRAMALQRKCSCGGSAGKSGECEQCAQKKRQVHRKRGNGAEKEAARAPQAVQSVVGSAGRPLEPGLRAGMEQRFGHSFADVRVHNDERAGESARAVNADAYTVGNHIAFQPKMYDPVSAPGQKLIAHELAHVTQQRHASRSGELAIGAANSPAEAEADRAANAVTSGRAAGPAAAHRPAVRRQPSSDYKLKLDPSLNYKIDPKIAAAILAQCDMGKGDVRKCAEFRALVMGQPLPPAPENKNLSPTSPEIQKILEGINKPPIFPSDGGGGQKPGAPKDPGPPIDTGSGPDFDALGKKIEKFTKFKFEFHHGSVEVSLPSSVTAQIRPIAQAREVVISAKAETSGTFTAALTIDNATPVSLSAKFDVPAKTATLALTIDSGRGDCSLKVPAEAIKNVQDAADKLVALFPQANKAASPATPGPQGPAPAKAPDPPKTGIEKAIDDVKAGVAKVQPEIDVGKAVAAFVEAISSVKDQQKDKCTKPRFQVGAFGQFGLGTPDPNTPAPANMVGLGFTGYF